MTLVLVIAAVVVILLLVLFGLLFLRRPRVRPVAHCEGGTSHLRGER